MKPESLSREEAAEALDRAGKAELEDRIPVADLIASGAEVGISSEAVRAGIETGWREQEKKELAARARSRRIRWWRTFVATTLLHLALGQLLVHAIAMDKLRTVQTARARVHEAVQRQLETIAVTHDPAELLGAENRVSIARRRYDIAAGNYNQVAGIDMFSKPVPLSNAILVW